MEMHLKWGQVACLAGQAGQTHSSMQHLVRSGTCTLRSSVRPSPEQGLCAPLSGHAGLCCYLH